MKLIFVVFFGVIAISISSPLHGDEIDLMELSDIHERVFKNLDAETDEISKLLNTADRECINGRLNLATNGERSVEILPAAMMITGAGMSCSKNYDEYVSNSLDETIRQLTSDDNKDINVHCIRRKMKELDSNTEVVEMENSVEMCTEFTENVEKVGKKIQNVSETLKEVEISDCVKFNPAAHMMKLLQTALLNLEQSDSFNDHRESFIKHLKDTNDVTINCLFNKLLVD